MIHRAIVVIALAASPYASAASFDCKKASGRVELLICSAPELSQLDERLAVHYGGAQEHFKTAQSCLRDDQLRWLRTVRNVCSDAACIKKAYLRRLSELNGLQPGMNIIDDEDLPVIPDLALIIPPTSSKDAVPASGAAQPIEATGRIRQDEGGYVFRGDSGRQYVLAADAYLDDTTASHVQSVVNESGKFHLRGHVSPAAGGPAIDPRRCVFLYRIPEQSK